MHDLFVFGRGSKMWVNFEISKLFITVILRSKVNDQGVQVLISCLISLMLLFEFNFVMLDKSRTP